MEGVIEVCCDNAPSLVLCVSAGDEITSKYVVTCEDNGFCSAILSSWPCTLWLEMSAISSSVCLYVHMYVVRLCVCRYPPARSALPRHIVQSHHSAADHLAAYRRLSQDIQDGRQPHRISAHPCMLATPPCIHHPTCTCIPTSPNALDDDISMYTCIRDTTQPYKEGIDIVSIPVIHTVHAEW